MTTKPLRTLLAAATLALPVAALAEGDSPWLPIPGAFSLSFNHTEQSADSAYVGSTKLPVSAITGGAASKYKRATTSLRFGYGLSDSVSFDAAVGFGKVKVGAADSDRGRTDAVLGANWRVLDEFERPGAPTLTLRGAAILKGDYDGDRLAALGNAQNGVELAVLLGKQITPAFALWAEVGAQDRSGGVPTAVFFDLGARLRFAQRWSLSLGYSDKKYGGDLDIGGPGFTPARFQDVRAERSVARLGVGYAIAANHGLALNLASVLSGRNTVRDDQIVGLSYTAGF
ncbi:MAG: hypothetical protein Q8R33_08075 [Burkholderiales bacterium]|nr:hypothetical protein [Burkholderiales bacterium]